MSVNDAGGGGGGGGGFRLGPEPNEFTGVSAIAARNARDANPGTPPKPPNWLSDYDGNENLFIRIVVGAAPNQQIFYESRLNGAWADQTRLIQGQRGATGPRGPQGIPGTDAVLPATASEAEARAGVVSSTRMFTPQRVGQAAIARINALVPAWALLAGNGARLAPPLANGTGGQFVALNAAGDALEYVDAPAGGGGGTGGLSAAQVDAKIAAHTQLESAHHAKTPLTTALAWSAITGKPAFAPANAEQNVNADWNATTGDARILNKPTIPAPQMPSDWGAATGVTRILNKPDIPAPSDSTPQGEGGAGSAGTSAEYSRGNHQHPLRAVAYSQITGTPTIPPAQVPADWDATTGVSRILNKPTIPVSSGDWPAQATAPASPSEGDGWYDTANDQWKMYDGAAWQVIGPSAGGGGGSIDWPDTEHGTIAAAVDIPVGAANDTWGAWTEVWRYTRTASGAARYVMAGDINPQADWTPGSGADRAGARFRAVHRNSAGADQHVWELGYTYIRNGNGTYENLSAHGFFEFVALGVELAQNDYLIIEGSAAAQIFQSASDTPPNRQRNVRIDPADFHTHQLELPALTGGGTGGGEDNVQADWDETDTASDAFIQNKPTLAPSNAEPNPPPLRGNTPVGDTGEFSFVPDAAADWINDNLIEAQAQRGNTDRWPLDRMSLVPKTQLASALRTEIDAIPDAPDADPLPDATAAVRGTAGRYATQDHVHPGSASSHDHSGGTSAGAHTRYAAYSTDATVAAGEFTSATTGLSSTNDSFTWQASISGSVYLAFAVPNDTNDITAITPAGGFNELPDFNRVAGTITIAGVVCKVWVSSETWIGDAIESTTWRVSQ